MINKIREVARTFREHDRPFRWFLGSLFMRLPFDIGKLLHIRIKVQDYYIKLHKSAISISFWINPEERGDDYSFLIAYLKPNDNYIDVGANIGTTLVPAAKAIQGGRAIAFEPNPIIFSYLKENLVLNNIADKVELHNCAVGSERGFIGFSRKKCDDCNGVVLDGGDIKVPVVLLDDVSQSFSRIALLKIDVEGYEKFVFEGGIKTLTKTDCVYFEMSDEQYQRYGYSIKGILLKMEELGFKIFVKSTFQALKRVDCKSEFDNIHIDAFGIRNVHDFMERTGWQFHDNTGNCV